MNPNLRVMGLKKYYMEGFDFFIFIFEIENKEETSFLVL